MWSVKCRRYLAVVKRIPDPYLHDTLLIAASTMEPIINLQLLCNKRSSFINHIVNTITSKENKQKNTNVSSVMCVVIRLFSIRVIPCQITLKKTILNPTLSEVNEIWHTYWFKPPNLKSKIFQWLDDRFPRYGSWFFKNFQKIRGAPNFKAPYLLN